MSGLVGLVESPMYWFGGIGGIPYVWFGGIGDKACVHLVGLMDSWWDLRTPYVNLVGFLSKYARLLVWQFMQLVWQCMAFLDI